tara:strand:+ start:463 stop:696 length:234 start_codon:yes stop_codon:yes gene_type:complete
MALFLAFYVLQISMPFLVRLFLLSVDVGMYSLTVIDEDGMPALYAVGTQNYTESEIEWRDEIDAKMTPCLTTCLQRC